MITGRELMALEAILNEAIVKSSEDDGDPVFHEVDVSTVNPFPDRQTIEEVYESLATKNLIAGSVMEDRDGSETEFVCITPQGLEALKSAQGVH